MTEPMLGLTPHETDENTDDETAVTRERYIYSDDSLLSVLKAVNYTLYRAITSGMADEHPYQFIFAVYDPDTNVVLATQSKCDQIGLDAMSDTLYTLIPDDDPDGK